MSFPYSVYLAMSEAEQQALPVSAASALERCHTYWLSCCCPPSPFPDAESQQRCCHHSMAEVRRLEAQRNSSLLPNLQDIHRMLSPPSSVALPMMVLDDGPAVVPSAATALRSMKDSKMQYYTDDEADEDDEDDEGEAMGDVAGCAASSIIKTSPLPVERPLRRPVIQTAATIFVAFPDGYVADHLGGPDLHQQLQDVFIRESRAIMSTPSSMSLKFFSIPTDSLQQFLEDTTEIDQLNQETLSAHWAEPIRSQIAAARSSNIPDSPPKHINRNSPPRYHRGTTHFSKPPPPPLSPPPSRFLASSPSFPSVHSLPSSPTRLSFVSSPTLPPLNPHRQQRKFRRPPIVLIAELIDHQTDFQFRFGAPEIKTRALGRSALSGLGQSGDQDPHTRFHVFKFLLTLNQTTLFILSSKSQEVVTTLLSEPVKLEQSLSSVSASISLVLLVTRNESKSDRVSNGAALARLAAHLIWDPNMWFISESDTDITDHFSVYHLKKAILQ